MQTSYNKLGLRIFPHTTYLILSQIHNSYKARRTCQKEQMFITCSHPDQDFDPDRDVDPDRDFDPDNPIYLNNFD